MRLLLVAALTLAAPLAALATEPGDLGSEPERIDIPPEEWTAMASGRTLSYAIDGAIWAFERYEPNSNRVTLQFFDGSCLEGVWEHRDEHYCFHWEGEGTSCFRHTRDGDRILVLETEDGVETGAVQTVTGISDMPLACGPAITS